MDTLPVNLLIQDAPAAVAVLDTNMCFIKHSQIWLTDFGFGQKRIIGKSLYDVIPNIPKELIQIHKDCLNGLSNVTPCQKLIHTEGKIQWLKWKINPCKDSDGTVSGLFIILEDITESKREEELLLMAESVARIGGWELDLMTNTLYWTKITKEIHEVSQTYEPHLEEGINFYKAGEHRDRITELVTDAMTLGKSWDTELIIVTAKKNEIWVRAKGSAELVNGKCLRIFGTFQEITQKKKAELKYQEATERLKIATSGSKIGIWDFDLVTDEFSWDNSMYQLYKIDKEDATNPFEVWQSRIHPDDKDRIQKEQTNAIKNEKEFKTSFRILWPTGEMRYIRSITILQRNKNGKVIKMIGTNWDITKLKTAQMELQKSEESFKGAFENSNIGMVLVSKNGNFLETNNSFNRILGYKPQEIIKLRFHDVTHPEDLGKDLNNLKDVVRGKIDTFQHEKRYLHKKGHIVHALLAVTSVKNIDGKIEHLIAQVIDLSPKINASKKLNRLVEVTTKQNNSLMNFAHIVSHNLRSHSTNLSMLNGFLNKENDQEEHSNLMRMLGEASESLNETVIHLNEVIQVKTEAENQMKAIPLCQTIKNVKKNLTLLLKDKHALCTIDISRDLKVKGIPAYLDSIFLNLFTNSLKYSAPSRSPILHITSKKFGKMTVIHFTDNGLGINLKRHGKKLFGMYKTFHRNKDSKGIGLFITKNQIEAMNGKIEVQSEVNKGTTFKLFFETA